MEEREFARYAFLIVAVVAVVGLLTSGGGLTGFATKVGLKAPVITCAKAKQMVASYCEFNTKTQKCTDAQKLAAKVCKARPASPPVQRQAPPAQQQAPPVTPDRCDDNELPGQDIAGNITFFNGSTGQQTVINDWCSNHRLIESYCDGTVPRWREVDCPSGCVNGPIDSNGVCVVPQPSTCIDNENYLNATGGINLTVVAGNVTFFNGTTGVTSVFSDSCYPGESRGSLTEYYCDGNNLQIWRNWARNDICSNNCRWYGYGACAPAPTGPRGPIPRGNVAQVGDNCYRSEDCATGLCGIDNNNNHVCEEPNPLGSPCEPSFSSECAQGTCAVNADGQFVCA